MMVIKLNLGHLSSRLRHSKASAAATGKVIVGIEELRKLTSSQASGCANRDVYKGVWNRPQLLSGKAGAVVTLARRVLNKEREGHPLGRQ